MASVAALGGVASMSRPSFIINLPGLQIESFAAADAATRRLAFVFTPYENRDLAGNPYGGALLVRHGFDVIAFKSSTDDWFQTVPEIVFEQLHNWSSACGHVERVAYGSSMGAYAAIAFSRRLGCSTVLALSPQYSIREGFDTRWAPSARRIRDWPYPIDASCIAAGCRYVLLYDSQNLDAIHIEHLAALIPADRLECLHLPFAGHPVSHYLLDINQLKPLVLSVLQGAEAPLSACKRDRSRSSMYLSALATANLRRSRPLLALRLVDAALDVAQRSRAAALHRLRSQILLALKQNEAAVEAIQAAVSIDASNPHLRQQLAQGLEALGRIGEALEHAQTAAETGAGNPHFQAYLGRLLLRQGDAAAALACAERAVQMDPTVSGFKVLRDHAQRHLRKTTSPAPTDIGTSPSVTKPADRIATPSLPRWLRWLGLSKRRWGN